MNEKSILLSVLEQIKAIFDCDQKMLQQIAKGTRNLLTIIECIYADGNFLAPSMIFEKKHCNLT